MIRTLRGRLVLLLAVVVGAACALLVVTALAGSRILLRRTQDATIRSVLAGACEGILAEAKEDGTDFATAARNQFKEIEVDAFRFELLDSAGAVVEVSDQLGTWDSASWNIPSSSTVATPSALYGSGAKGNYRVLSTSCGPGYVLRVVTRDVIHDRAVRLGAGVLLLVLPLALGAGILLGRAAIARALRPLDALERAAERMEAGTALSLGVRAEPRELARLERSFDALLERLGNAIARERRFSQEASHELRTPLTVLRARVEHAAAAETDAELHEHLAAVLRELDALDSLVEALLHLSRAQEGALPRERVNLADVARGAAASLGFLGGVGDRSIEVHAPDEVLVRGSEDLLSRAVANLLENARKFAGSEGHIRLTIEARDGKALLVVEDDGPGIPEEARERVFERFYRDPSERDTSHGAGLGLAVVQSVVLRHGGTVRAGRSSLGGAEIRVELPLA